MRKNYLPDGKTLLERSHENIYRGETEKYREQKENGIGKLIDRIILVLPELSFTAFCIAIMINAILKSKLFD